METTTQEQNEQGQNKQFDQTMKKLIAILGGKEKLVKESKLPKDDVKELVESLLSEEKETRKQEFKAELKTVLTKYIEMVKAIEDEKKKLEKLEKEKNKEFVAAANKVFEKVEQLNELETSYYASLNTVKNAG